MGGHRLRKVKRDAEGKPTGAWYVEFYDAEKGDNVRRSTRLTKKREAERAATRIVSEYWAGKEYQEDEVAPSACSGEMQFNEAIIRYLNHLESSNKSDIHVEQYIQQIRDYVAPAFSEMLLKEVRTPQITRFRDSLHARGLADNTVNKILSIVSAIFQVAVDEEMIERVPRIPRFSQTAAEVGRALDTYHLKRLLAAARSCTPDPQHNLALFWFVCLGAFCGLRAAEATKARWDWIEVNGDKSKATMKLPRQKNKTMMRAPVGAAWRWLEHPPVRDERGGYISLPPIYKRHGLIIWLWTIRPFSKDHEKKGIQRFPKTWPRIVKRACRGMWKGEYEMHRAQGKHEAKKRKVYESPYDGLRFHDLRHTFCTTIYKAHDMKTAMTLARHRSIASAMRYIHLREDEVFSKAGQAFSAAFGEGGEQ